jgi:hypothetical protein
MQLHTPGLRLLSLPVEIGFYSDTETDMSVKCRACPEGYTTAANTSTTLLACSGELPSNYKSLGMSRKALTPTCRWRDRGFSSTPLFLDLVVSIDLLPG